jgi:hypothetical protein
VVAVLAVAALGLTACGGDADGEPGTSASPATSAVAAETATPTPSPSATPEYKPASADGPAENVPVPKMPDKAKEKSEEGLKAFAEYWYANLNYAFETGEMAPLEAISGQDCGGCNRVKPVITEWNTGGRWLVGGKLTVSGSVIKNFRPADDGTYQVLTQVDQATMSYYNPDGSLEQQSDKEIGIVDVMNAEYSNGAWSAKTVDGMG